MSTLKLDHMPELKLRQLQFESDSWKRLLGFIIDENIHLKNRLSEVLKNGFGGNWLEEMETFHNQLVKEDERISLLRNEIAELDRLLVREVFDDGRIIKDIDRRLKKLRHNITNTEEQFGKLKLEFNSFLTENILSD